MPAKPAWHGHLPHIRDAVARFPAPILDRAAIERIFALGRRQAIRLMATLGGHQLGRTYLVHRDALLERLDAIASKKPVSAEITRKERLCDALAAAEREARPRTTRIVPPPSYSSQLWPQGVQLAAPGELRISFESAEDLLGQILALSEAAAGDYELFAARLRS